MKRRALIAAALATLVAASLAASAGADTQAGARSEAAAVSCKGTINIGNLTVLTGPAAFLGQSQQSWAVLAAKQVAPKLGLKARIIGFDTTLDPAVALTAAQRLVGNRSILATLGPATSGGAASASATLAGAQVVHVSPSATATDLTKGSSPTATRWFYRVVADDGLQGPGQAKYAVEKLNADKATVFDAQEPYSVGLAEAIEAALKRRNVTVQRLSTTNNTSDFSSFVTRIPSDTDVVFTPFQVAANANQVAVLLKEQGKRAVVFGADGTVGPAFKVPGSYVSNFAPDLAGVPGGRALLAAWQRDNPGRTVDPFGPPAYGAVQTILYAAKRACAGKSSIERINIKRKMKAGPIPSFILGGKFKFSSKTNDPLNGGFWLFQIQPDGSLKQIAKL
jgi:branched-chain amino acid transport system substrate-binding protein